MKKTIGIILLLVIILGGVIYFNKPKLEIISGYAAKNMASTRFIAAREAESIENEDNDVSMIRWADTEVINARQVEAEVIGLAERSAACRDGLGCVVVPPGAHNPPVLPSPRMEFKTDSIPYPYGQMSPVDTVIPGVDYDQVKKALDLAFAEPDVQRTRTALILYKGQLVGERYAEGFTPDTPILGWSMTKSLVATLYGVLEHQGKMRVQDRVPIAEWQDDERRNITYEHLLRMNSSLAWEEDYSGISDVTRMLFQVKDMSKVQAQNKLVAPPGEVWNYSSGSSNILSGELYRWAPDTLAYLRFPYKVLAQDVGMHSLTIETDWVGNLVGSSYGWASTRDWGRFGQLYLDEGSWNGTQVFGKDWIKFITTPTPGSDGDYGAHFWLNRGGTYPSAPADLYSADGYQGQHVFIIPSKELVIVRTGLAEAPDFDADAFIGAVLKAIE